MGNNTRQKDITHPLSGPIKLGEFRARLAEMADRVLNGEEITVLRGNDMIGKFVPADPPHRPKRRLGTLNDLLTTEELAELDAAIMAPLSDDEQRILEGEGSDDLGIWQGLPETKDN